MKKIGLIGGGFQHAYSTTLWKKPKHFEWSKNKFEDITFFIDNEIESGINHKCGKKIAWLVESRDIIPNAVNYVKNNWQEISKKYDLLLTHDATIYDLSDNFHYLPPHGYWIGAPQIYNKIKLISMISSNKSYSTGHKNRLKWVEILKDNVDLYGRGFKEIHTKEEGLKDYMFSVTIENDSYPTYWSEKILDCFASGTIPIYYGSPDISDYFNMDGIILLNDDFDIKKITEKDYYDRIEAIKDNFNRAMKYDVIEDIIFEKWIK
jgi:hypothetical protein